MGYSASDIDSCLLSEPVDWPERLKRSRALLIAGPKSQAIAQALVPPVEGTVRVEDPYEGMIRLLDDPRDWCLCVIDTELFESPAQAEDFLRILCFEHPGVPVVQINTYYPACRADLVLAPGDDAATAGAALALATTWFASVPLVA